MRRTEWAGDDMAAVAGVIGREGWRQKIGEDRVEPPPETLPKAILDPTETPSH